MKLQAVPVRFTTSCASNLTPVTSPFGFTSCILYHFLSDLYSEFYLDLLGPRVAHNVFREFDGLLWRHRDPTDFSVEVDDNVAIFVSGDTDL
jgi:hypothetical protein